MGSVGVRVRCVCPFIHWRRSTGFSRGQGQVCLPLVHWQRSAGLRNCILVVANSGSYLGPSRAGGIHLAISHLFSSSFSFSSVSS